MDNESDFSFDVTLTATGNFEMEYYDPNTIPSNWELIDVVE